MRFMGKEDSAILRWSVWFGLRRSEFEPTNFRDPDIASCKIHSRQLWQLQLLNLTLSLLRTFSGSQMKIGMGLFQEGKQ